MTTYSLSLSLLTNRRFVFNFTLNPQPILYMQSKNNNIYAKKIIMACKAGGPDPTSNRALASTIAEAKAANVPNDVIKRNLDKASAADTADYKDATFEYYGHGGVGLVINVVTDNGNRATNDVNLVAKKKELKGASGGSVTFNFDKKARIDVKGKVLDEDDLLEMCMDAGVDDYALHTECDGLQTSPREEGDTTIFVEMAEMASLRDALLASGSELTTSLQFVPKDGFLTVNDEDFELNMEAVDAFEALDDVDSVHHNLDTNTSE
jgi:YebC/PmpR family DNA-binding regulatory protein